MANPIRKKSGVVFRFVASALLLSLGVRAADVEVVGKVKVEVFTSGGFTGTDGNLPGAAVADLTGASGYPGSPTTTLFSPLAEFPFNEDPAALDGTFRAAPADDVYNNYGVRLSGFLRPPSSGVWYFYIASAENSQLWISSDANSANKVLRAQETAWSNRRYYFNLERSFPGLPAELVGLGGDQRDDAQTGAITADGRYQTSNVSDGVTLVQGQKYYFEALMKSSVGKDNLSIWATQTKNPLTTLAADYPDYPDPTVATGGPAPLSGAWISALGSDQTVITAQPASRTNLAGAPFRFEVKVTPGITAGRLSYKWFKDDVEVLNKSGGSVNSPVLDSIALGYDPVRLAELADDATLWKVEITPESGDVLTSEAARLTVLADDVPPRMVQVTPADSFASVLVQFDSPISPLGVLAENFSLTGVTVTNATLLNPSLTENSRILLQTDGRYAEGTNLVLTVTEGVRDRAGNPTTPSTNEFRSYSRMPGVVNYLRFENEPGAGGLENLTTFRNGERVAAGALDAGEVITRFGHAPTSPNVDNFFGLVRGWLTPPATGDYEFFLASDDTGVFWLSTDETAANLKAIAVDTGSAAFGDFLGSGTFGTSDRVIETIDVDATPQNIGKLRNRSGVYPGSEWPTGAGPIHLVAGRKYYAVGLHKEEVGSDGLAVGVKKYADADATVTLLSAGWLEGYGDPTAVVTSLVLNLGPAAAGQIRLEWTGNAKLYSAPTLADAFAEVVGAASPYTPTATSGARFYQLKP